MHSITARNVNEAFPIAVMDVNVRGIVQSSQHGTTIEYPDPVSVCYMNPLERVLFDPVRDANPFFQLFEALWILAGRKDVAFLTKFNQNMVNYSDDGETYFGAYGFRLKDGADQIAKAIERLKDDPTDRQVVLTIRAPYDLWYRGKDTPCNMMIACKIRNEALNIHVFNRSNDLIWGMMGTNVVQFSMLHEYMANKVGVRVGTYHQTTDSMHVYDNEKWVSLKDMSIVAYDPYEQGLVEPFPLGADMPGWDEDLKELFARFDNGEPTQDYITDYFVAVVEPLYTAWEFHKQGFRDLALSEVSCARHSDWQLACFNWLNRRYTKG